MLDFYFAKVRKYMGFKGLKLIDSDQDVQTMFDIVARHGLVELFVVHEPEKLADYYFKNLSLEEYDDEVVGWAEEDDRLAYLKSPPLSVFVK
jgi:hypothetical protein